MQLASAEASNSTVTIPSRGGGGADYYNDDDDYEVASIARHTNFNADPQRLSFLSSCWDKYCSCCFCCFYCRKRWKVGVSGLLIAMVYWAVLYLVATSYSPGQQRFNLTVGETWRVQPPLNLWSRKALNIRAIPVGGVGGRVENNSTGLEVYVFLPVLDYSKPAVCPPLTLGEDNDPSMASSSNTPIVTLHDSDNTLHLEMDQYHFEYFHLNKGSILKVHAELIPPPNSEQTAHPVAGLGACNIYILQGYHILKDLETQRDNLDIAGFHDFRGKSIAKRFLAYAGAVEFDFVVPHSDYYMIVYDNAAPGRSTNLQVSVTAQMATYFLSDVARPICNAKDTIHANGCSWIFTNDQDRQRVASTCIIVKATSHQLNNEVNHQLSSTVNEESTSGAISSGVASNLPMVDLSVEESQSVIVEIHAPIGSTQLLVFFLLPIALLVALWFLENGQKCIQHLRRHGCRLKTPKKKILPIANERTPLKK